jgi:anti-sigma factor RsiW
LSEQATISKPPPLPFDEALLSGYVDGELTQAESQRVRIFIEDHPEAARQVAEIRRLRQAARSTSFHFPADSQWDERPRGPLSGLLRRSGGLAMFAVLAAALVLGLWQLAVSPLPVVVKVLAFAGLSGFLALFGSVLVDRLRVAATDRYRRVLK